VCLFVFKGGSNKTDLNKLALRIGELRQYRTMGRADVNSQMEKAFSRIGYNVVTSTEDNLYPSLADDSGVNFYVRGYTPFNELKTNKNAVNVVYIRDFDALYPEEMDAYDGIATSSHDFYNYVIGAGYAALYLPEFTDPSVCYPSVKPELERNLLFVGDNNRHSPAIAMALEAELPLEIYGRFWQGMIDDEFVKGEYIHDNDLKRDKHALPFSMSIDFSAMIQALKEIGYQGYLTLEADSHMKNYDVTTAQLGVQKLYEAAKRLKEMFEA
jgi:hypothetical protein